MSPIELNKRQEDILQIVKENGPITGEHIAERLNLTRATFKTRFSHPNNGRISRCKAKGWLFLFR